VSNTGKAAGETWEQFEKRVLDTLHNKGSVSENSAAELKSIVSSSCVVTSLAYGRTFANKNDYF